MSIYKCLLCTSEYNTAQKLAVHISNQHMSSKEYYDRFLKKENEDICIYCKSQTIWISLNKGYKDICSHACAMKKSKNELKNNEEKFQLFKEKVRKNQINIWNDRKKTGEDLIIRSKIGKTRSNQNQKMTDEERRKKYSRYYTMTPEAAEALNKKGIEILMARGGSYANCTKGRYKPINHQKYKGDIDSIIYRSSWELRMCKYFDHNPAVVEWSSEEIIIPYRDPVTGRVRRYYPDFKIKVRTKEGETKTVLIEIKPDYQTKEPAIQKRKTKRYITEVQTYITNRAKWKAAEAYCSDRRWDFQVLTEKHLGFGR